MTKHDTRTTDLWDKACAMVVSSPEILSGTPVIRGTRVPVHDVGAWVQEGVSMDEILAHYPGLTRDQVELSRVFVEASPPPTPQRRDTPEGAVVIVKKVVPL